MLSNLGNEYIYSTVSLTVKDGYDYIQNFEELKIIAEKSRKEEGCKLFIVVPGNVTEREILLWEIWESNEALDIHEKQEYIIEDKKKNSLKHNWTKFADASFMDE